MSKQIIYDVVVIGAGAAGLMAAITSASRGKTVLVLDHHVAPAKKILATGNGKCNFTNNVQNPGCYRSEDSDFVMHVIESFDEQAVIRYFEGLGVLSKDRNGYVYPRSGQASTIREALLSECRRLGVSLQSEVAVKDIRPMVEGDAAFHISTKQEDFLGRKCILATGGKASPKTGSDGSGFAYAKRLGHRVSPLLPCLTPLISGEKWLKMTSGVRCDAAVTLMVDREVVASDTGELQLTDYGISGIPVFQISRFAAKALHSGKSVSVKIDFLPEYGREELKRLLELWSGETYSYKSWYQLLAGFLNQKIAAVICSVGNLPEEEIYTQPDKKYNRQLENVLRLIKEMNVSITDVKGFEQAQVTCGGVSLAEVNGETMESRLVPGLYFAGEMLDVDGICGGYNLQWAWSSGHLAGSNV